MKHVKKALTYVLTVLMLFLLIATGCSENTSSTKETVSEASGQQAAPYADGSNHFTLYYPETTTPINLDGPITQEIMKKSGIIWDKVEIGNGSDVAQQVNLKIASGTLSDVITLNGSSVVWSRLINSQLLIPLDTYFDDAENYPNLAKIDKRILDYWRASDGNIYFHICPK